MPTELSANFADLLDADLGDARWCMTLPISVHFVADHYWAGLYCLLVREQDPTVYMNIAAEMSEIERIYGLGRNEH